MTVQAVGLIRVLTNIASLAFPQCFVGHPYRGIAYQHKLKEKKLEAKARAAILVSTMAPIFVSPTLHRK